MRIIILTQYFFPEVGAAQNRLLEFVKGLQKKGVEIEVLTAMPNYPKLEVYNEYKGKWYVQENVNGISIHRAWIWARKSRSSISRLLNYFSFVFTSMWIGFFKVKKADYIICESPPLFLGISAIFLKKVKRARLIFNVADLWPETAERLGIITNKFLLNISRRLEGYLYESSVVVIGQTKGIVKNIKDRFPNKEVYWLPNGIDSELYNPDLVNAGWREKNNFSETDFILMYAGTIGHIYSWEMVLKAAQLTSKEHSIKWLIIGAGAAKEKLVEMKEKMGISNVFIFEPVPRTSLPEIWKSVNALFLPLLNLEWNKGVVPAKSFEAMAMKVPILLGAEGEAKEFFIDEAKAGLSFIPEDTDDFVKKVLYLFNNKDECLKFGENGRNYVMEKFERTTITNNFYDFLNSIS